MRITSISTRFEKVKLTRPYRISRRLIDEVDLGFVEIGTDAGLTGLGSASPAYFVTGESVEACQAVLSEEGLAWLIGRDVRKLPSQTRELERRYAAQPAAQAAIDIALHDLWARQLGLPLVEVLGRAWDRLPTSITIGILPLEEALDEAREFLARGFRAIKVKIGHDLDADLERLHRLRELCGPEIPIYVDPNQGYEVSELRRFFEAAGKLALEFVEQPLVVAETDELRSLPSDLRQQIALDESLHKEADAIRFVEAPRPCGIFNIKLMKSGGLRSAGRIATIAETTGMKLMWGCMDESVISISAALHAALASPATRYLDLDGSFDLAHDPGHGGFVLEDGMMRTTDEPGLGVSLRDGPLR